MKRIVYRQNIFWITEEWDARPIPPRFNVEEEAELIIRLESTRSGLSARWMAGPRAREAFNQSPHCPLMRAVVRGFSWEPPDTRDCRSQIARMGDLADDEVRQVGSNVINWRAYVVRPLEDPLKEVFERILNIQDFLGAPMRQGALEARGIPEWIAPGLEESQIPLGGSGSRWFFNHALLGVDRFDWRVPRGTRQAVALIKTLCGGAWVLSPEHPEAPLALGEGRWYILTHPIPADGVD
jgi:hypothetical protein